MRILSKQNRIMKLLRICLLTFCVAVAVNGAQATTVNPPTFDQLVRDAESVFEGTVTKIHSEWFGTGVERVIVTYITFDIHDSIKGAPGTSSTIRMLGGTIGDETQEVADAPRFKIGDRDILFVEHNGNQFIPLVGIMHGRFHLRKDAAGREIVTKDSGAPVSNVSKLGVDEGAAVSGSAISSADFKSAIRQKLAQL